MGRHITQPTIAISTTISTAPYPGHESPTTRTTIPIAIGAVLMMRFAALAAPYFDSAEIVELHHGTIAAEFPEDGGSRFLVRLPLAEPRVEGVA